MKVKQLKELLAKCEDDDDIAIRLFPTGFSDVYSVERRDMGAFAVVWLFSYPRLSELIANSEQIAH